MKKFTLLLLFAGILSCIAFSQKTANGTVYIDHPALKTVSDFIKATVSGDESKISSFLSDDFKSYNGTSTTYADSGSNKAAFVKNQLRYSKELDYFTVETMPGTYPDAVEYKKDNTNEEVWVQTWDVLKGVHKTTGVKIDAAAHRLYKLSKDNKIKTIVSYNNAMMVDEIAKSTVPRTNGKIYNHHENINTVRKSTYAFEKGDLDKALSYYSDDATFYDINAPWGKSMNKTEIKKSWQKFLNDFEIKSIEVIGYPDYLEYEIDGGREVLSWWKFNLIRKSDKKVITLPMHISNGFNAEGKIDGEVVYYSESMLTK